MAIFSFLAILTSKDPLYGVCMAMSEIAAIKLKLIDSAYIIISWGILDLHMDPSTSGHFSHPYFTMLTRENLSGVLTQRHGMVEQRLGGLKTNTMLDTS